MRIFLWKDDEKYESTVWCWCIDQERQLKLEEYRDLARQFLHWVREATTLMLDRNFPATLAEMRVSPYTWGPYLYEVHILCSPVPKYEPVTWVTCAWSTLFSDQKYISLNSTRWRAWPVRYIMSAVNRKLVFLVTCFFSLDLDDKHRKLYRFWNFGPDFSHDLHENLMLWL